MALVFIDGNELRASEVRQALPGVELVVEALQTGFSTSAPEPGQRARDKVLAHPVAAACFAEAVDLTTMDGKSLRLELDSENENRFCKWWRETPARMLLVVAVRRAPGAEIELVTGACDGRIADKPAGPHLLGWDRLFVPAGDDDRTLAQLAAVGEVVEFRREVYAAVGRALGAAAAGDPGGPGGPGGR
ncbi:MAG: non-canonical purine NTP pyrophosphatase [Deltaproteobacteria bacterium]|nr:MAG: non-canonical purine NTP pyrophosphatase [Deltaproteobacteria bacterium]TMQ20625.1 MAG: non-canonical purine NTP pyrophosphatase [Deltaproteobacteria bacterium]